MPPTVQAVLAARIDGLPAAEKRLLQEAAVIGHDVPFALLHAICGLPEGECHGLLGNLERAEFLYATHLFPDLQYTWRNFFTHDVAYSGLLHERRREIHGHIVEAMEKLYADRLGEQVERLAEHASRGQLRAKAVGYLRQAGTKAADRQAYQEAVALFEQALAALAQLPETRENLEQAIDLRFDMRNVLQPLGDRDRIAECLRESERLATRLDDPRRMAWVQWFLTENFWILGRYSDAVAAGEQALAIAREAVRCPASGSDEPPSRLGLPHARGLPAGDGVFLLERDAPGRRARPGALRHVRAPGVVLSELHRLGSRRAGRFRRRRRRWRGRALRIAEAAEHPFSCGYAHLGSACCSCGRATCGVRSDRSSGRSRPAPLRKAR